MIAQLTSGTPLQRFGKGFVFGAVIMGSIYSSFHFVNAFFIF